MGTKYSTNAASGYNATPPADNGEVSEANKIKYSTLKEKLADPVKDLADAINTDLVTHFNIGPVAVTANTTLGASHYNQVVQVNGSLITLTLSDAATLTAGWYCRIINTDSGNTVTIARATAGDTINGSAANFTLPALHAIDVVVTAAATGFLIRSAVINPATTDTAQTFTANKTMSGAAINFAAEASVASAATTNIGAAASNSVTVSGTTTITAFDTVASGISRWVRFFESLTLTNSGALDLGGSNIVTQADDVANFLSLGSGNWQLRSYLSGDRISKFRNVEVVTATGTFTAKVSGDHVIILQGGGGGGNGADSGIGGGGHGGGGAGEFRIIIQSLTAGTGYSVTIGAAGAAGANGGDTQFDATAVQGGRLGVAATTTTGGAGGRSGNQPQGGTGNVAGGSGGAPSGAGGAGGAGAGTGTNIGGGGGAGGSSPLGIGGNGGNGGNGAASPTNGAASTTGFGGGGGGGGGRGDSSTASSAGGAGAAGVCIVLW